MAYKSAQRRSESSLCARTVRSADAVLGRFAPALSRGIMNVISDPLTVSVPLFHLIVESTLFRPKNRQILCMPCPPDVEATDLKASLG